MDCARSLNPAPFTHTFTEQRRKARDGSLHGRVPARVQPRMMSLDDLRERLPDRVFLPDGPALETETRVALLELAHAVRQTVHAAHLVGRLEEGGDREDSTPCRNTLTR